MPIYRPFRDQYVYASLVKLGKQLGLIYSATVKPVEDIHLPIAERLCSSQPPLRRNCTIEREKAPLRQG